MLNPQPQIKIIKKEVFVTSGIEPGDRRGVEGWRVETGGVHRLIPGDEPPPTYTNTQLYNTGVNSNQWGS